MQATLLCRVWGTASQVPPRQKEKRGCVLPNMTQRSGRVQEGGQAREKSAERGIRRSTGEVINSTFLCTMLQSLFRAQHGCQELMWELHAAFLEHHPPLPAMRVCTPVGR